MAAGIVVQLAALIAAVLGIYLAEKKPYTHIASGAVVIATIAGIVLTIQSDRDAAFTRQTLSHLVRSVPPSLEWKGRVTEALRKVAATKDRVLYLIEYDKADFKDPQATAVYFFKSLDLAKPATNGLLVVTPTTYSDLFILDKSGFETAVRELVLGRIVDRAGNESESFAALSDHVQDVACALYGISRIGQGFKISLSPSRGSTALVVECGDLRLVVDTAPLADMLNQTAVERDLRIAQMVGKTDSQVARVLRGPG